MDIEIFFYSFPFLASYLQMLTFNVSLIQEEGEGNVLGIKLVEPHFVR